MRVAAHRLDDATEVCVTEIVVDRETDGACSSPRSAREVSRWKRWVRL
jgi:hypothetical protein